MSSGDLSSIFGGGGFDTHSCEPQTDYEVLPPGKYPVLIESAEVKQTKAGTGHYIKLRLRVLDGPGKNRKVFDNINIDNPSQQAAEIGRRQLAALGQALGLMAVGNTDQLLNQAVVAHVKVKDEQNEVRTYSPISSLKANAAPPAPPQTQYAPPQTSMPGHAPTTTAGAPGKPPWAR